MSSIEDEEKQRRDRAFTAYVFGAELDFQATFGELKALAPAIRQVAEAFVQNITAAANVVQVPFRLTNQAAVNRRFQAYYAAARIRALMSNPDPRPPETIAKTQLNEFMDSEDGRQEIAQEVVSNLGAALEDDSFAISAKELLLQTAVMIWASLEVLAFDGLVALLNAKPRIASTVASAEATKRYFQRGVPLELLAQHSYNLTATMGDLLMSELRNDLGQIGLTVMKDLFGTIFSDDAALRSALHDGDTWKLFQQRHLIVHRRGVIDRAYVEKTDCTDAIGSMLSLTRDDIEKYFKLSGRIGGAVIAALNHAMCA